MKNKETKSLEAVERERERELYFSKQKNEQIKYRPTKLLMLKNSIGVFWWSISHAKKVINIIYNIQFAPSKYYKYYKYYKYFNIRNRQSTRFSCKKAIKKLNIYIWDCCRKLKIKKGGIQNEKK